MEEKAELRLVLQNGEKAKMAGRKRASKKEM